MNSTIPYKHSLILVALLGVGLIFWPLEQAWNYLDGTFQQQTYPSSFDPVVNPQRADLNGDGAYEELRLANQQVSIFSSGKAVWSSPPEWEVQQAALADLNRDGHLELVLLLWRPFRPWPVDSFLPSSGRIQGFQNSQGMSCHLILIGWKKDKFRELWAGSAMAEPLNAFATGDINGDGFQELVAAEGNYADQPRKPASALTAWEWNGFGFTLLARSSGNFRELQIVHTEEGEALVLNR